MQHSQKPDLSGLSHPDVRELGWAIGGASLMAPLETMDVISTAEFSDHFAAAWASLRSLDEDPAPLTQHLQRHAHWKVGLRFEALVGFWLEHVSPFVVLGQDVQVRSERQTRGAFDVLLRSPCGRVEHWELAIKYYLQREPADAWSAWVGPGARDRLDLKLNRMSQHQLPLSKSEAGRAALARLGVREHVTRRAMVKGMFFRPWRGEGCRPEHAEEGEPHGLWLRQSQLRHYLEQDENCRYLQRNKPRWLAPARTSEESSLDADSWLQVVHEKEMVRPLMASRLRWRPEEGAWCEDTRFFVVQDAWPLRGQAPSA